MADTRKHRITIRDELDAQLLAQLGDQAVRPYEAGELHRGGAAASEAPATDAAAPAKPARPAVLGSFTFVQKKQ